MELILPEEGIEGIRIHMMSSWKLRCYREELEVLVIQTNSVKIIMISTSLSLFSGLTCRTATKRGKNRRMKMTMAAQATLLTSTTGGGRTKSMRSSAKPWRCLARTGIRYRITSVRELVLRLDLMLKSISANCSKKGSLRSSKCSTSSYQGSGKMARTQMVEKVKASPWWRLRPSPRTMGRGWGNLRLRYDIFRFDMP